MNQNGPSALHIFLKDINGKNFVFRARPTDTVYQLQLQIQEKTGFTLEQQLLIYAGKQLQSNYTLADYGVQEACTIFQAYRQKGGFKFHK